MTGRLHSARSLAHFLSVFDSASIGVFGASHLLAISTSGCNTLINMEILDVVIIPKKRKLKRPAKASKTEEQKPNMSHNTAKPETPPQYSLQPESRLLALPAEIRQSIIRELFCGVKITLANARTLDNQIYQTEETEDDIRALADHRPNILRVTAVCKQLRVEAWRVLSLHKFKAHRLGDIVSAEDAGPLLARVEHLSIDIDSTWAFYDHYAQPRFPSLRSISTRYVNNCSYTDYANFVNTGFEYAQIKDRIKSAFATGTGIDLRSFVGNLDVQWATYKKSVDIYARIEFLSWKRTVWSIPIDPLRSFEVRNY